MLFGQTQSNAPSRFLDDLPDDVIERRSDDVLSAFAWASRSGFDRIENGEHKVKPFTQESKVDAEFNQDIDFTDDFNQDTNHELDSGSRVRHPTFGLGIIASKRGDIVEIRFDSGENKTFALSIAPLEPA